MCKKNYLYTFPSSGELWKSGIPLAHPKESFMRHRGFIRHLRI